MKYSYDEKCLDLARHFFPTQSIAFLEALAQEFQDCVEGREDLDDKTLPIPDFLRNQENLRAERASQEAATLCDDCPPVGYPTDKTRCAQCPRMETALEQEPGPKPGTNTGHGHVWKRPDGMVARCGGPGMCPDCSRDKARLSLNR